jgi:hypothetical protein
MVGTRRGYLVRRRREPQARGEPRALRYLLDRYFPDHRGVYWREGRPLPEIPRWFLHGKKPSEDEDKDKGTGASATGYQIDHEHELQRDDDYEIDRLIERFLREDDDNPTHSR